MTDGVTVNSISNASFATFNTLQSEFYYCVKINLIEKTADGFAISDGPLFSNPDIGGASSKQPLSETVIERINKLGEKNILSMGDGNTCTDYAWIGVKNEYNQITWGGPGDYLLISSEKDEAFVIPSKLIGFLMK